MKTDTLERPDLAVDAAESDETLEDVVEFFNLIEQLNLSAQEKKDLVAFLRVL